MDATTDAKLAEIAAITEAAGDSLMRTDLRRIKAILASMPDGERYQVEPWLMEGIWMRWAVPTYRGDIKRI